MIYMRIWGGLGNQMFQYAFIRALQLQNHEAVRLCFLPEQGKGTVRQYGLDRLNIQIDRDRKAEKAALFLERHEAVKQTVKRFSNKMKPDSFIEEKEVRYCERLKHLRGNCYISGFVQNEKYFKDCEEAIRRELRPKRRVKVPDELERILDSSNTVSVHVRRTDYKRYGNLLGREYYERALKSMDARVENAFYLVFSDDISWVKRNLRFGSHVYFVNENRRLEDYEELFIMSRCRNHIIANSTFSWWGAWLNTDRDKIVVGPQRWFSGSRLNIMPDGWIKV